MSKTVAERLTEIEGRLDAAKLVEQNLQVLVDEVARVRKTLGKHTKLFAVVDEHRAVQTLDRIHGRVSELADMLQIELLKQSVCSEVSRIYPDTWPKIVLALDQPNEWWKQGEDLTISEWQQRLNSEQSYSLQ